MERQQLIARACLRDSIAARHVLVLVGFLGLVNVYLLRVNLNVAIVAMVSPQGRDRNNTESIDCPKHLSDIQSINNQSRTNSDGSFDWSPSDQGIILGSIYYGFVFTNTIGGATAERFGGTRVFGLSILVTALLTLLTPSAARYSKYSLIAIRVLEGSAEGFAWPSMHTICGRWLPIPERAFLYSLIHTGAEFGTIVGYPIAALLVDSNFLGGWPATFYIFGAVGIIWYFLWTFLIFDTPSSHPRISEKEKKYILENMETVTSTTTRPSAPWFKILTSLPVWSVAWSSFLTHWAFQFIFVDLSSFLSRVLHYDIKTNGLLSCLPHVLYVIVQCGGGLFADFVLKKKFFGRTATRKALNFFSCLVTGVCFLGVIFSGCNRAWILVFIIVGTGAQGLNVPSFYVALLDMAPEYAGSLMGFVNGFGSISSCFAPYVTGYLTDQGETLKQWHTAFYIATAVILLAGVLFTVFGSSDLQPWAKVQDYPEKNSNSEERCRRDVQLGEITNVKK